MPRLLPAVLLLAAAAFSPGALAQVPAGYVGIATGPTGLPARRSVSDVATGPDGALYAAGLFWTSQVQTTSGVFRRTGETWTLVGDAFSGDPTRIAFAPDGSLWALGSLTTAGGTVISPIARFDGTAWASVGATFNGGVTGLAIASDGTVVVTGSFSTVNGAAARSVAQFRGGAWSAVASAPSPVFSVGEPISSGADVYVSFVVQLPTFALERRVARVTGGTWASLGAFPAGNVNYTLLLAAGPSGELYATNPNSVRGQTAYPVYQFVGGAWTALAGTFQRPVEALAVGPDGAVVAASVTTLNQNGTGTATLSQRVGTTWVPFGTYSQSSSTSLNGALRFAFSGANVYAGGSFLEMNGLPVTFVGRYDGAAWNVLGSESNGNVLALASGPGGDVYAAGDFTRLGGAFAFSVGRWDGSAWRAVGAAPDDRVFRVVPSPDGSVVACGTFTQIGGVAATRIARWTGAAWSALGAGLGSTTTGNSQVVGACASGPDGVVYASGPYAGTDQHLVSRWDGAAWTTLVTLTQATQVTSMTVAADGALVVAGDFTTIGGVAANRIARWSGGTWSALGSGFTDRPLGLAAGPDGEVVAVGSFSTAGGVAASNIARWNGTAWSAYGTGLPRDLFAATFGPDGTLYAAGGPNFAGLPRYSGAFRWDGAVWTDLVPNTADGAGFVNSYVRALVVDPRGDVILGGEFTNAGAVRSLGVVRFDGPVRARVAGPAGYRMLAPPAAGQTVGSLLGPLWTQGFPGADAATGAPNVFLYDEAAPGGVSAGFGPPASAGVPAAPGAGVFVYAYEDADYTTPGVQGGFPRPFEFAAAPPAPPLAFPVSYTPTPAAFAPADDGWNLLGNPFAGVLDWDTLTRTGVDATVYAYDPAYLGGGYRVWNGTTGSLAGGLLAPMQGFWAHATAAGASLAAPSAAVAFAPLAARGSATGTLRLEVRDAAGTPEAEAFVSVAPDGTLAVDALDGYALDPIRDVFVRLATEPAAGGAERLAIQSLPDALPGAVTLPLAAEAVGGAARSLTLAWDAAELPAGWSARIVDTVTGAGASMAASGTLPFDAAPRPAADASPALRRAAGGVARFQIVVAPAAVSSEGGPGSGLALAVGPNPTRGAATAFVSGAAGTQTVEVLDALGRRILRTSEEVPAGRRAVALPDGLAPGVYVVRVTAGDEARSVRLVVVR